MTSSTRPTFFCAYCFSKTVRDGRCEEPHCGREAFDFNAHKALPPGLVLNESYRIGRVLGAGGLGITYLAKHVMMEKFFAIKELFPDGEVTRSPHNKMDVVGLSAQGTHRLNIQRERFLAEAKVLADIDGEKNPEIVKVYNFFSANGTAYIVMPFLKGQTLMERVVQEGVLHEVEVLPILAAILKGLKVVHLKGILHQDIKPDNVYLVKDAQPVLIDFGNARLVESDRKDATRQGGTPGFAPPEQRSGTMTQNGDIYALGASVYVMLTGCEPPSAEDRVAGTPLVPGLEMLRGRISPLLLGFLDRSMRLSSQERYANVEEVLTELKPLLFNEQDWTSAIPESNLAQQMRSAQLKLESGKAYPLIWNWRPAFLSYFWFLALRVIPIGLGFAGFEAICGIGALFSPTLYWVWLCPIGLSRLVQGYLGNWLVYRDLERHVKQLRASGAAPNADRLRHSLSSRLQIRAPMIALAVLIGPISLTAAAILAHEKQLDAKEQIARDIMVGRLLCKMKDYMAANDGIEPVNAEQLGVPAAESGGQIAAYRLIGPNLVLTLGQPEEVANKQVTLIFDRIRGQYTMCKNIDVPAVWLPDICRETALLPQPKC